MQRYELSECKGTCGKVRYIVNRKYWLCRECNHDRIHGAGSADEKKREAELLLREKVKRGSGIKKKSKAQQKEDRELQKVYEEFEKETPYVCSGCGSTKHLSHSHIIRRSWLKLFVTIKKNITWHCLVRLDGSKGCHDRWESTSERQDLQDYEKNMAYIKKVQPELYWQMKYREKDLGL